MALFGVFGNKDKKNNERAKVENDYISAKELYDQEKYSDAFGVLLDCAKKGHPEAQNLCGEMYRLGQGVEKNHLESIYWYEKAAEQGCAAAQYCLGLMKYRGFSPIEKDKEVGLNWLYKAANQGHEKAINFLKKKSEDIYFIGYDYYQKEDYANAFQWFLISAEYGLPNGFAVCAVMHMKGQGVEKNKEKELNWCKKLFDLALELPDEEIRNKSNLKTATKLYFEENFREAAEWLYSCFDEKEPNHILKLCWFVMRNRFDVYVEEFVEQFHSLDNIERCNTYFKLRGCSLLSKEQNDVLEQTYKSMPQYDRYMFNKFLLIKNKKFLEDFKDEPDTVKAIENTIKSVETNLAMNTIFVRQEGQKYYEEGNYSEALKCYEILASDGDAGSQALLAEMYLSGKGVPVDYVKAFSWYKASAEQGLSFAQYVLGILYYNGNGTQRNVQEGIKWMKKAAEQGHEGAIKTLKEIS